MTADTAAPRFTGDDVLHYAEYARMAGMPSNVSVMLQAYAADLQAMPTREEGAKIIYDAFPYDGQGDPCGRKPKWVDGGNAKMQERARDVYDKLFGKVKVRHV